MSDAREEAAIARDALVRDKKKPKQQTTLLTKWNIVLDYGESGLGMNEYCALLGFGLPAPDRGGRERQGRRETTLERGQSGSSEAWCLPRPRGSALLFPSLRRSPPVHLNRQRSADRL